MCVVSPPALLFSSAAAEISVLPHSDQTHSDRVSPPTHTAEHTHTHTHTQYDDRNTKQSQSVSVCMRACACYHDIS